MRILHSYKTLRVAAVLIVVAVLINPLPMNGGLQALAAQTPPRSDLIMSEITRKLSGQGFKLSGSGSWIGRGFEGKSFRDPLNPKWAIKTASDFDMTLLTPAGTPPDVAAAQWRDARKALTELVTEQFKGDPAAGAKILDKINMYPPDQLMVGVKSNAEALARCAKYGAVPKLNYNKPLTDLGLLDADDLVGGVYGEGAQASRRWKEMTQGLIFENGQRKSAASHMVEEGIQDVTFTVKGSASMAKQWSEFARYWIEQGDPVTAEKYISRLAADLKSATGRAGFNTTNVASQLQEMAATLKAAKGPEAAKALAGMQGELASLVSKAEYQASILERITGASANQANLLRTLLDAADHTDSKLAKLLDEAMRKAGGAIKLIDILVKLNLSYEAVEAARGGNYDKMLASLLGLQNLNIPASMLGPLVQAILDDAKSFGYDLVASRQSCDDLMDGIFIGGKVEAESFTFDKLVDTYKTEDALQKWVRDRSIQAADRGFEGAASDKITKGSADAVYQKCYAYVLGGWIGLRQQLYDEVRLRWSTYAKRGADLVAQPEPAYLDLTTGKVTVQVTASSKAQQDDKDKGYPNEKALQALGARLSGKPSSLVRIEFPSWSLAPDAQPPDPTKPAQSFTFSAPGEYEVKVKIKLIINNDGLQTPGMLLDRSQMLEGSVKIHVLKAEDKPLCGGGPVVKSAVRTTLLPKALPIAPGQVASPGPQVNASGNFLGTGNGDWIDYSGFKQCFCSCAAPKLVGTFEMAAGGKIKGVVDAPKHVPYQWSLGNINTGLAVYFEPRVGKTFGRGERILARWDLTTGNADVDKPYHVEAEADVPGPGRLTAYIIAPKGDAPTNGTCFEQSYTAKVDVLSVGKQIPANGEAKLALGDRITTDGFGEAILTLPSGMRVKLMPNTDVSIERDPNSSPDSDCQDWTWKLNSGRLRVWSDVVKEMDAGATIKAGAYTIKP